MNRKHIAAILVASAATLWMAAPTFSANLDAADESGKPQSLSIAPPHDMIPPLHDDMPAPRPERHHQERPPLDTALAIARRLSVAETYIGIKSTQMDAWRSYTTALLAFVKAGTPTWPTKPGNDDRAAPAGEASLCGEDLADRAIVTAEKARILKDSIRALTSVLSDEQVERLREAESELPPMHVAAYGPPPEFPMPDDD